MEHSSLAEEIAKEAVKLKVTALKCQLCGDVIYSRDRHDFRKCTCGAISIDGGFDYMKVSFDQRSVGPPEPFELGVDATKQELYDDYRDNGKRFGIIRPAPIGADRPRARRALPADRKPRAPRRKNNSSKR